MAVPTANRPRPVSLAVWATGPNCTQLGEHTPVVQGQGKNLTPLNALTSGELCSPWAQHCCAPTCGLGGVGDPQGACVPGGRGNRVGRRGALQGNVPPRDGREGPGPTIASVPLSGLARMPSARRDARRTTILLPVIPPLPRGALLAVCPSFPPPGFPDCDLRSPVPTWRRTGSDAEGVVARTLRSALTSLGRTHRPQQDDPVKEFA